MVSALLQGPWELVVFLTLRLLLHRQNRKALDRLNLAKPPYLTRGLKLPRSLRKLRNSNLQGSGKDLLTLRRPCLSFQQTLGTRRLLALELGLARTLLVSARSLLASVSNLLASVSSPLAWASNLLLACSRTSQQPLVPSSLPPPVGLAWASLSLRTCSAPV